MAAYNAERFIADAIASVMAQTYTDWELMIVNDCSKDRTKEVVSTFKDERVKLIDLQNNSGAGIARNKGLENAKGSFIAFLDADDVWVPEKLEAQLKFMQETNAPICHTSYSFINEEGQTISGYVNASKTVNINQYMQSTEIGLSTAMINKTIVGHFAFNPMRLRQDTRLWIDLLNRNLLAYGLDKTLVKYRIRQGQISGNKFKAAYRTLKLYLSIKELPLYRRLFNFCCYFINGILKRLKK